MQEELNRVENHYTKLEAVVKGASRLLGDCKAGNIGKEIWKLKQEDIAGLKTHISHLKVAIISLDDRVKGQDVEITRLRANWEGVEKIRSIMEYEGDIVTKAHLFDEDVRKEGQM